MKINHFTISIKKAVGISTKAQRVGKVGRKYLARLSVSGGKNICVVTRGRRSAGRVNGVRPAASSSDLTYYVTDPLGGTAQKMLTLTVRELPFNSIGPRTDFQG